MWKSLENRESSKQEYDSAVVAPHYGRSNYFDEGRNICVKDELIACGTEYSSISTNYDFDLLLELISTAQSATTNG